MKPRNTQYALLGTCYAADDTGWACLVPSCLEERTLLLPKNNPVGTLASMLLEDPHILDNKCIVKIHPKTQRHFDRMTIEQFTERQKKWQSN